MLQLAVYYAELYVRYVAITLWLRLMTVLMQL